MAGRRSEPERVVATNRRARHDYEIVDRYEAGIQLTGDEVKSLRAGRASLVDSFARVRGGEVWLEGLHIPPYEQGDPRTHRPLRPRKLLLHRAEIAELERATAERGLTLVPLRVAFVHGLAKVELGLGRGKRRWEKRQAIAKREAEREVERAVSRRR
ncbi:MAG: SsrA-binding protein [Actinomycetota bacterium]|jgi:SsrA-binding protein|nr:MAG: SsrA-binding protein [Actinomycetota bacterium]